MLTLRNPPAPLAQHLEQMKREATVSRLWARDYRIWQDDPTEIANRLAWLHLPEAMPKAVPEIEAFAREASDQFAATLLFGMGGSSLAPEMFATVFPPGADRPVLHVLDSTHPSAIRELESKIEWERTQFIVATKSGTTTETLSFFRYFYDRAVSSLGTTQAGRAFTGITDPGSPLLATATKLGFRNVFENDPHLGGRYSALSHFGLVPAATIGVPITPLLERARHTARLCAEADPSSNPGALLGAFLAAAAEEGRDKATFFLSDAIGSFGDWVEQLIAESTGKQGVGILPVVREAPGVPDAYEEDRVFVSIGFGDDSPAASLLDDLEHRGHPVARLHIDDPIELGSLCFLFEFATAIAGSRLRINPFDQPNVESAKVQARRLVREYESTGTLPHIPMKPASPSALSTFLKVKQPHDYIALQAYLPPGRRTSDGLRALQAALRDATGLATTAGLGPRFLHSTGQLHKGDRGNGLFVQLLAPPGEDLSIPSLPGEGASSLSFGALFAAQAAGDRQALLDNGRRVVSLQLEGDAPSSALATLAKALRRPGSEGPSRGT